MEEHRIAPDSSNVISGAFAFIVTILITLILSDLLKAAIGDFELTISFQNIALLILTAAIGLEALIAAFDNYAFTQARYDPLHRGIASFEIIRYLITFSSVVFLYVGVTAVADSWRRPEELASAATVVMIVIILRYLTEIIWQATAFVRTWQKTEWSPLSGSSLPRCDPYTDEACRTLFPSLKKWYIFDTYWGIIVIVLILFLLGFTPIVVETSPETKAVVAGTAVFVAEGLYIRLWKTNYYEPLLQVEEPLLSQDKVNPEMVDTDEGVKKGLSEQVSQSETIDPDRLARAIKYYHDDPRYEFRLDKEGRKLRDLLKLVHNEDEVDSEELLNEFCPPSDSENL
jgi:hypothetical protein